MNLTTVLGKFKDTAPFVGQPGYNVYPKSTDWTPEKSRAWIAEAVARGDEFLLVSTDFSSVYGQEIRWLQDEAQKLRTQAGVLNGRAWELSDAVADVSHCASLFFCTGRYVDKQDLIAKARDLGIEVGSHNHWHIVFLVAVIALGAIAMVVSWTVLSVRIPASPKCWWWIATELWENAAEGGFFGVSAAGLIALIVVCLLVIAWARWRMNTVLSAFWYSRGSELRAKLRQAGLWAS